MFGGPHLCGQGPDSGFRYFQYFLDMTVKQKIRTILGDLESVRENLLSLSDDIWLDIAHKDSEALREGTEFKLAYNEKMA